ncbi:MAG: hypothetical protein MI725_06535, partial [Pirellulales bacterium]|nr:hypothetical protein [Pirellulales bacterium]
REAGSGRPTHVWHNWDTISNTTLSPEVVELMQALGQGVVRLKTPLVPSCRHWNRGTLQDKNGCTAFRIADDLFATNWHCLSESMKETQVGEKSCNSASITFAYEPPTEGGTSDSTFWGSTSESCKSIEYINSRLDFAIFRVSRNNYSIWGKYPTLRFLPGAESYPQTTTDNQRFGDRLAILHYPRAKACKNYDSDYDYNVFEDIENIHVKRGYQTKLKVSTFGESNPSCRVWVMQPGNFASPIQKISAGVEEEGSVKAILGTNHSPESICDEVPKDPAPSIGLLHRCDTCAGSSGSPLISTQTGTPRFGTVVGIHAGHFGRNGDGRLDFSGNFAIRASKVSDCVNLEMVRKTNSVQFSVEAEKFAVCKAEHPRSAPHLNCLSQPAVKDCRFYEN